MPLPKRMSGIIGAVLQWAAWGLEVGGQGLWPGEQVRHMRD